MFPALATVASPPEWVAERALLVARIAELERQVAWFQRQLFGEKSERRHIDPPPEQMALGEGLGDTAPATLPPQPVAAHQRQPRGQGRRHGAGAVLRSRAGAGRDHQCAQPRDRRAARRGLRGRRREGHPPPRPAPGQLCGTQVRANGRQGQGHRGAVLPPGPGGRAGGRARRCQLPGRPDRRQVPLSPAAVPPAPTPARRRGGGQPPVADPAGPGGGAPAGPHRGGPTRRHPRLPGQGDGRNPDQGRAPRSG